MDGVDLLAEEVRGFIREVVFRGADLFDVHSEKREDFGIHGEVRGLDGSERKCECCTD